MANELRVLGRLDLPDLEGDVVFYLVHRGPANAEQIAQAIGSDIEEVAVILAKLVEKEAIRRLNGVHYEAILGRAISHKALPDQLWSALLSTGRLYSEQ